MNHYVSPESPQPTLKDLHATLLEILETNRAMLRILHAQRVDEKDDRRRARKLADMKQWLEFTRYDPGLHGWKTRQDGEKRGGVKENSKVGGGETTWKLSNRTHVD